MEIVNIGNRKQLEITINGKECIMSLSLKNISFFQEKYKIGLAEALQKIQKDQDLEIILKLIKSMISDAKTGKVVSEKFWNDMDELSIVQCLSPYMKELLSKDMPSSKK